MYFTGEYAKQPCDRRRILRDTSIATFQMGNGKQNAFFPPTPTTLGKKEKKKNHKENFKKGNINGGSPS